MYVDTPMEKNENLKEREKNASTRKRRPLGNAHFFLTNPHREEYAQAQQKPTGRKRNAPKPTTHTYSRYIH